MDLINISPFARALAFLFFFFCQGNLLGQNYIPLTENTGVDIKKHLEKLEIATADLAPILQEVDAEHSIDLASNFDIYDVGFYIHNTNYEDGLNETLMSIRGKIVSGKRYIIFARESSGEGLFTNLHVLTNLPSFNCFSSEELERRLKIYVDNSDKLSASQIFELQEELISKFISNQLKFLYVCCAEDPITGDFHKKGDGKSGCVPDAFWDVESKVSKQFIKGYLGCQECLYNNCPDIIVPKGSALETAIDKLKYGIYRCNDKGVLNCYRSGQKINDHYVIQSVQIADDETYCLLGNKSKLRDITKYDYGAFTIVTEKDYWLFDDLRLYASNELLDMFKEKVELLKSEKKLSAADYMILAEGMGCVFEKLKDSEKFDLLKGLLITQDKKGVGDYLILNPTGVWFADYSELLLYVIDGIDEVKFYEHLKENRKLVKRLVAYNISSGYKSDLRVLLISKFKDAIRNKSSRGFLIGLHVYEYPWTISEGVFFRWPSFEANNSSNTVEVGVNAYHYLGKYFQCDIVKALILRETIIESVTMDQFDIVFLPRLSPQGGVTYYMFPAFMLEFLTQDVDSDNLWATGQLVFDIGTLAIGGVGFYSLGAKAFSAGTRLKAVGHVSNILSSSLNIAVALVDTGICDGNENQEICRKINKFLMITSIISATPDLYDAFKGVYFKALDDIKRVDGYKDVRKFQDAQYLTHRIDNLSESGRINEQLVSYLKTCGDRKKVMLNYLDDEVIIKISDNFTDYEKSVGSLLDDLIKSNKNKGALNKLVDFFNDFPEGVKAWDVFQSSSDDILKALRTDVPTLTRFTDDFGNSTAAINQIKNSPDLLRSWHLDGAVLHRHYAGSSSWPVIQIDDAFKANVRSQYGDDVGDLVDAVDDLNISNNAAVGGGAYHPSLPSPSSNPNTAVNFLSGEVADGTAQAFINALHPILKKRVDYLEFLKSHNLIDASQQSITTAGKFGSHAEFRVLDKAIKDLEILEGLPAGSFPVSRLDEFTVFVKAKQGTNPPRCVCCWHGTDGVRMIGNE